MKPPCKLLKSAIIALVTLKSLAAIADKIRTLMSCKDMERGSVYLNGPG